MDTLWLVKVLSRSIRPKGDAVDGGAHFKTRAPGCSGLDEADAAPPSTASPFGRIDLLRTFTSLRVS